jgi:hypothetical protein
MTRATCLATPLRDKLHEKLHRVTGPLGTSLSIFHTFVMGEFCIICSRAFEEHLNKINTFSRSGQDGRENNKAPLKSHQWQARLRFFSYFEVF